MTKRTRINYTIYSANYQPKRSNELAVGECWDNGTIRGAKRKARSLGIGSIFIRNFEQEDSKGRFVGDWWQTAFCWVWDGFGFPKVYPIMEKKWVIPDLDWSERAKLRRIRSTKF